MISTPLHQPQEEELAGVPSVALTQFFGSDGVDRMQQQTILIHHLLQHSCGDVLIGLEIAKNIVLSFGAIHHDVTFLIEISNMNFLRDHGKGLQEIFQTFSFLLEDEDEDNLFSLPSQDNEGDWNHMKKEIQRIYEKYFASKGGKVQVFVEFCDHIEKSKLQDDQFISQFTIVSINNYSMLDLITVNENCRKHDIEMIASETRGLVGSVFCDFGNSFVYKDLPHPNSVLYDYFYVIDVSPTNPAIITLRGGSKQGQTNNLKEGDVISLEGIESMPEIDGSYFTCLEVNYLHDSNLCVTIDLDASILPPFNPVSAGFAIRVCKETISKHKPITEILQNPSLEKCVLHVDNPNIVHASIMTIGKFYKTFHRVPHSYQDILMLVAATYSSQLATISSLIGGIAAMEIQKAASGYYEPIPNQLFYFDAFDCVNKHQKEKLVKRSSQDIDPCMNGTMYSSQALIFGQQVHEKIENSKHLLYTIGPMGCEYLKNYLMMGVGNGLQGSFLVSDDKKVSMKHLGTHFLFRRRHVGLTKAEASAEIVQKLKHLTIHSSASKTQQLITPLKESSIIKTAFSVDMITDSCDIISAVDFMEFCNRDKTSLIKTTCNNGVKYNLQIVVPYVTNLPENLIDEKPYYKLAAPTLPIQCLNWAETFFYREFTTYAETALTYVKEPTALISTTVKEHMYDILVRYRPNNLLECLKWARLQFEILFNTSIQLLIDNYPFYMITTDGTYFWSVTKRFPRVLNFDLCNPNHVEFVLLLFKFRAQLYGFEVPETFDILTSLKEISHNHDESVYSIRNTRNNMMKDDDMDYGQLLQQSNILSDIELHPYTNYEHKHYLQFIYIATILRCENFRIVQPAKWIIWNTTLDSTPSILSISSIMSALGCLEFYKVIQGFRDSYNNATIDVTNCLTLFTQTPPKNPTISSFPNRTYCTFWDTIDIDENIEITLKDLVDIMKECYNLEISMCSTGRSMLYSFFTKRRLEDLSKPISQLVFEKTKTPVSSKFILIDICCHDLITLEEMDDIPPIRYRCYGGASSSFQ
ncbi:hypothetical protein FDP41_008847 [Naegleria fowleri]|uniref:Ubiquitin-activating enzyme E1 C-terminal domain-containing protein n=1 Tax=Naegleria fowleri TaxID=5763 RepID=A0A6A5BF77_NAEFO|nr:uncharacterized protein FDP41_008847 [Naegleria fowleri]KAF0972598.1 hypothetical protein FDP41_008847 [Naegleria fowleri]